jgi:hyaluronan synthase
MAFTLAVVGGIVAVVAAGYLLRPHLFTIGIYSLSFYGIFTISHFVGQVIFASMNRKRWQGKEQNETVGNFEPSVSVVVPTYKEDPALLRACLESIANQNYGNISQVILSNDGGDPSAEDIFKEVSRNAGGWGWIYLSNDHQGKRGAMYSAFNVAKAEVIVCMDSDTIIDSEAIRELVKPLEREEVGCSTGNIRVLNYDRNILTMLADLRYWLAFNMERAAQSFFGVMTCVSGPLGAYRRTTIEQIKDSFVGQRFLGTPCSYGDDRHLTNLVLSLGLMSVYVPQARAETDSPPQFRTWCKQQLRWSRSFYREFFIGLKWLHKHNFWLTFDITYQATFPFFVMANIAIIFYLAFNGIPELLLLWISLLVLFGFIRALYGVIYTRDLRFFKFMGYAVLYIAILMPLKVYALATLWNPTWGTK